ncbi:unnamed protein product [Cylicocyclus nassatus]|uniref:Beta-lactamase-related domain-containing protein n=1 Tax=Cylicocyclus nassatus TaxID=53992 RepID=A0AA36M8V7_CYLNA|nr:unnamed protein product [Cylicocyclus nassatus]
MGFLRYAAILGVAAILIKYGMNLLYSKHPLHFGGKVDSKYKSVRKAFEQNFIDELETEGASFAVYVKGQKVVDLWGGYADLQAARTWREDTLSVVFSTTKAVAALCIAVLADRGKLSYDDLVSKHWPGFAKNGKENITIGWVMSHMAGLYYFEEPITKEMATNHNLMRELIENETPKVPPGTSFGYHAYTFGWLVDQIVRHTDGKKRGIGQFLREEITGPNGIDFHIGLDLSEEYRVARAVTIETSVMIKEILSNYRQAMMVLKYYLSRTEVPWSKALSNPSWMKLASPFTMNDPEQHAMEQAAALGIGNARALAKMFNLLVTKRLISEKTLALLKEPVVNGTDYVMEMQMAFGHGFIYHPPITSGGNPIAGHAGYGCQEVNFDITNGVAIAYVTNGLKLGMFEDCPTYSRLQKAVYDVLQNYRS